MAATAAAARFYDGRHGRRHDVLVQVRDGVALIRSIGSSSGGGGDGGAGDAVAVDWPLAGMTAAQAPTPDGVVPFRLGRRDPARLVVDDPALLEALRRGGIRRWPRRQAGWGAALAACVAVLGVGIALIDALPGVLAPLVPLSWEAPLGEGAQALLLSRHRRCTGAEGQRALDRLTARLAESGGISSPVQLVVVDDPMVNAVTLPGNRVLVMRGLIAAAGSGDELAGVLGHEFGHTARRDPTRQILRQLGLGAIAAALGWGGGGGGIDAGGIAQTLLGLSYGRAAETAADAYAVAALRRAGLRADGLGRFFARIEAGDHLPGSFAFLSDHPATAERRRQVEQPSDGAPALSDAEWQAVRTMCEAGAGGG